MKQWIFVVAAILLVSLVTGAPRTQDKGDSEKTLDKPSEKTYPKKVTSLKKRPTKAPSLKSPLEAFKDLPNDDLEFIKELDKQFKLHGDKIKIKVERDNSTLKNSKRTVEGDLGYGYYNGQQSAGYDYPKPSFSFYPYSQQDIPASAPGYQIKEEEESTVSIVPSYSYELKQTNQGYETNAPFVPSQQHNEEEGGHYQQQEAGHEQGHGYQHNEPVIVLRIPGPTKYASHLQVLLQQYLEIRAAQYLKILEEAELQKHQQLQQQQQHQQVEQLQYDQVQEKPQEVQYQHQQEAPQNYGYVEQQQQDAHYPAIDDVYQTYKSRHQEATPIVEQQYEEPVQYAHEQQQHQQEQQVSHEEPQQQYYYMQVAQPQPAHAAEVQQGYQPIYYLAMPQSEYGNPNGYGTSVPQGYVDDGQLPIAENNPRHTHTKVHFTEPDNRDHSTQYPLPSIKPFERHAPTTEPIYPPYPIGSHGEAGEYQQSQEYQLHGQASNTDSVISITQRPYNYHAHAVRGKNSKRNAVPAPIVESSGDSLKKLHTMINRLRTSESSVPRRTKKEVA